MSAATSHTVRLEPVGIEIDVVEGETVLDAAFRQGIALMHGCKEGQCGSCKSRLVDGDIELMKYSTFALPDYESETNLILLCRTHVFSDITVELLNYDEDLLHRSIPVREYEASVVGIRELTHDIRLLRLALANPLRFWAGQYVDLSIPENGVTRSFSMANPPSRGHDLEFIIKKYADGAFSSLLDGGLRPGDVLRAKGPYGTCFRREGRPGPMLLIGGGSGMSPLWSILHDHLGSGEQRPVRLFYGARTRADLLLLDEIRTIGAILAGGATPVEQKKRLQLIEDAINAARAAIEEGIVPGGGTALVRAASRLDRLISDLQGSAKRGAELLQLVLTHPLLSIAANCGLDSGDQLKQIMASENGIGLDARTGRIVDLLEAGIVDPVKVTYSAVRNAASVAGLILTTQTLIAKKPDDFDPTSGPALGGGAEKLGRS